MFPSFLDNSRIEEIAFCGAKRTAGIRERASTFFSTLRSHGPLYATGLWRMTCPKPLDEEKNWKFWTKKRSPLTMKLLEAIPSQRRREAAMKQLLSMRHEVGIAAHYDSIAEVWPIMLDEKFRFYTPIDYDDQHTRLNSAAINKAANVIKLLDVRRDCEQSIIDLGCGLGGMLEAIARYKQDARNLLGLTISESQIDYAKNHGTLAAFDIRKVNYVKDPLPKAPYDRMICLGGIEHIRPDEIETTMKKWSAALKPGGKMLLEFFTLNDTEEAIPSSMLLAQLVFPGSLLSKFEVFEEAWKAAGLNVASNETLDYKRTLRAWYNNVAENMPEILSLENGLQLYNGLLNYLAPSYWLFDNDQLKARRVLLTKPTSK